MKKIIFALFLIWAGILPAHSCLEYLGTWGYGNTYSVEIYENYLYAGCGKYLKIYDISIPNYPKFLSEIMLSSLLLEIKVEKIGKKIIGFVGTEKHGLTILDLTDPESPIIFSRAEIPCFAADIDIEIKDNLVFIALAEYRSWEEGTSGVHVYDISDIYNPKFIVHFGTYAYSIAFYKNYAVVGYAGLQFWDISNIENPIMVSAWDPEGGFIPFEIVLKENIAYVPELHGFYIFDISNPENIKIIGNNKEAPGFDLKIIENYAIIASLFSGLIIIDLKDIENPKILSRVTGPYGNIDHRAEKVSIYKKSYAYVANYNSIWVINLLEPASFFYIDTGDISSQVEAKENYLFITQNSLGIEIIDFSNPNKPIEISRYKTKSRFWDKLNDIYLDGNLLYFGSWEFFGILDVTDPKNPIEISCIENKMPDNSEYWPICDIKVRNGYAYTACYFNGLKIYNVKDPKNPYLLSSLPLDGITTKIDFYENIAYLSSWIDGLYIIDISNPENPIFLKNIAEFGAISDVEVYENKLYVFGDYFYLCNISDPLNPRVLGMTDTHGIESGKAKENLMFIASFAKYLKITDISNDNNPYIKEFLKTSGSVCDVKLFNNYLIVSNFDAGIEIYDAKECFCKHKRPF